MKTIIAAILLILFLPFVTTSSIYAQEDGVINYATGEAELTQDKKVEYDLAYPGILPDHPLYFLKASRDRLISYLINDSQKRAEFNLLTADKRIYAGIFLVDKNKDELAVSTISKGNNYYQESLDQVRIMKKSKKLTGDIVNKLVSASEKYEEVLVEVEAKIDNKYIEQFKKEQARVEKFRGEALSLVEKK